AAGGTPADTPDAPARRLAPETPEISPAAIGGGGGADDPLIPRPCTLGRGRAAGMEPLFTPESETSIGAERGPGSRSGAPIPCDFAPPPSPLDRGSASGLASRPLSSFRPISYLTRGTPTSFARFDATSQTPRPSCARRPVY